MRHAMLGFCAAALTMSHAATINVKGVVSNASGKAVPGATVTLVGLGMKATSATDGAYLITGSTSVQGGAIRGSGVSLSNGLLEISVRESAPLHVEVYDVGGHLLREESVPNAIPGSYRWDLAENARATSLLLVRVAAGGEAATFRYASMGPGGVVGSASLVGGSLARTAAVVDTLKVEKTGYVTAKIAISGYELTQNIVLDSALSGAGRSAGCGKALGSLATGYYTITSSGISRRYAIDIPTGYDPNKAYRLIYASHWIGSKAEDLVNGAVNPNGGAANWAFYGLKRVLDSAGQKAIFIAPSANGSTWGQSDHALFDNLLNYAKTNLCVDTARVFAVGFSFGAMITNSLSLNHQSKLRAVATLAAANYNIYLPTNTHQKIAYLGITGMSDGTCPFINSESAKTGGLFCAITHATDNGCSVPSNPTKANPGITTTTVGSKKHVVYDFSNCAQGYPVRMITFDGAHIAAPTDGQTSDDGRKTWAPHEIWKFFSQF